MNENKIELHFEKPIFADVNLLEKILESELPIPVSFKTKILGFQSLNEFKVVRQYIVELKPSITLKVDLDGELFTEDTPERLAKFKKNETNRVKQIIAQIETDLAEHKNNILQVELVRYKKYLEIMSEMKDTPFNEALTIACITVDEELTDTVLHSIQIGANSFLSRIKTENSLLSIEVVPKESN